MENKNTLTNWEWTLEIISQCYDIGAGIPVPHERVARVVYGPMMDAHGFNRLVNRWGSYLAIRAGRIHGFIFPRKVR